MDNATLVKDFIKAVKAEEDYMGLLGHQPSLVKVRKIYKSGLMTDEQLVQVVKAIVAKHGCQESYESIGDVAAYMFCSSPEVKKQSKPKLSPAEQTELIKSILPQKKKPTFRRKAKPKAQTEVDYSIIPDELKKELGL